MIGWRTKRKRTRASAIAMRHCTSSLFSLRLSTFNVRFRFNTCARYVTPDCKNPCQDPIGRTRAKRHDPPEDRYL